jgi:hypothetical protein
MLALLFPQQQSEKPQRAVRLAFSDPSPTSPNNSTCHPACPDEGREDIRPGYLKDLSAQPKHCVTTSAAVQPFSIRATHPARFPHLRYN